MKNNIIPIAALILLITFTFCAFTILDKVSNKQVNSKQSDFSQSDSGGFVVLELFTSQGCSSCPPADEVLAEYAAQNNPNIIPLAFHVDYWNYIGWKDPFSKAEFTNRQRNYASLLNGQGNYTPQVVINGKHELVGSYKNEIKKFVNQELAIKNKFTIDIKSVTIKLNTLTINYETDAIATNNIVNVALVKKKEFTSIKRGENKGLNQTNYNIVYDFKSNAINSKSNNQTSFNFNSEWQTEDFIAVAYVQNTKTGQILTATKALINY